MTRQEKAARNEKIAALRRENWSMADIAERFGITQSCVSIICKNIGLGGKRSFKKPRYNPEKRSAQTIKGREADEPRRIKLIEERLPGFEYFGNFTGSDGTADIRCKKCGTVITRSWVAIRHGNVACDVCRAEATAAKKAQGKAAQEAAKEAKAKAQKLKKFFTQNQEQLELRCCAKCGAWFVPKRKAQQCCSRRCAESLNNTRKKDRRLRLLGGYNEEITLPRLYQRDGGICYLCGKPCNWQDFEIRDDGTFIAGDWYPSIDHVVALHDGGAHAWDNVRLAHRWCNSKKH